MRCLQSLQVQIFLHVCRCVPTFFSFCANKLMHIECISISEVESRDSSSSTCGSDYPACTPSAAYCSCTLPSSCTREPEYMLVNRQIPGSGATITHCREKKKARCRCRIKTLAGQMEGFPKPLELSLTCPSGREPLESVWKGESLPDKTGR